MFVEAFFLACLTVAANAGAVSVSLGGLGSLDGGIGLGGGIGIGSIGIAHAPVVATAPIVTKSIDYVTPPKYAFKYGVSDQHTGDNKQQAEERIGDVVRGEYSLAEPDGTIRVVKYTADKINGFNAVVSRIGKAIQPSGIIAKSIGLSNGVIGIGGGGLGYY